MDWTQIVTALITSGVVLIGYIIVDRREKNKQLDLFKQDVIKTLNEHRLEYLKGIDEVKDSVTDMRACYQQNTAVLEIKIDALEKKQDKHNNVIERTYALERDVEVLKNRESVSEHRIEDLEKK